VKREELIEQLIALKKEFQDTGEPPSVLWGHFAYEVDHKEVVWVEESSRMVAFADFSWVSDENDIERAYRGEKTKGEILNIITVVCTRPGLIWELKKRLPKHKYLTGMRGGDFHAHRRRHAEMAA
jgi:hypothetical protein